MAKVDPLQQHQGGLLGQGSQDSVRGPSGFGTKRLGMGNALKPIWPDVGPPKVICRHILFFFGLQPTTFSLANWL